MIAIKDKVLSNPSNPELKKSLYENVYRKQYLRWFIQLRSNFNLLFYGIGSKKQLLDEYCYHYLIDGPLIIVNGYFPQITIKLILNKVYDKICQSMNIRKNNKSNNKHFKMPTSVSNSKSEPIYLAQTIVNLLNSDKHSRKQNNKNADNTNKNTNNINNSNCENNTNTNANINTNTNNNGKRNRRQTRRYIATSRSNYNRGSIDNPKWNHYYLLIHNIDGVPLRNYISQKCLSILADCSKIHLIASVDHIHSLFLWDHSMLAKYHWIYHEMTTYKHYYGECIDSFDNPIISSMNNQEIKARGIKHVLKSLTPNHCDLLEIVANKQIEKIESMIDNSNSNSNSSKWNSSKQKASIIGMSYKDWYDEAQSGMLVTNDLQFRKHLTELTDHSLVVEQKNFYKIPYSVDIIKSQILDLDDRFGICDE